jgi:hypothetical protein
MFKVAFSDFYHGYEGDLLKNPITAFFAGDSSRYEIVKPDDDPDLMICSIWGGKHVAYPHVPKIMWVGENLSPGERWAFPPYTHWNNVDWVISCNYAESIANLPATVEHYYVPYAGIHYDMNTIRTYHDKHLNKVKSKFCCFVSSAKGSSEGYLKRYGFFDYVNTQYQRVDSGGKQKNNLGYCPPRDETYFDWISDYKFMICFENSQGGGYLTEKIFAAYAGATIPIYWGDLSSFDQVRKEACLFYTTPEETLAQLKHLNEDEQAYQAIKQESLFYPQETGKSRLLERNYLVQVYDEIMNELRS